MKNTYIPYEKLSKRVKKQLNAEKRNTWGLTNPVTKKVESRKTYDRNRAKHEIRAIFA